MKAAVRNAPGKLAGGEVLGMEAKVAVVGNLGFRIDPAGVVGAGCDAVFAADTAVRIHRDDVGFRIVVAGARWADLHARRIHALLAGNADVVTVWARHALQKHTRAPWGEVICFVAGAFAFAASDAFILVEDHHVVRALLAVDRVGGASSERNDDKSAGGCREEASPVNVLGHLDLPSGDGRQQGFMPEVRQKPQ
mgnify:FL=1